MICLPWLRSLVQLPCVCMHEQAPFFNPVLFCSPRHNDCVLAALMTGANALVHMCLFDEKLDARTKGSLDLTKLCALLSGESPGTLWDGLGADGLVLAACETLLPNVEVRMDLPQYACLARLHAMSGING